MSKKFDVNAVRYLMKTQPNEAVFWSGTTGFSPEGSTAEEYARDRQEFGGQKRAEEYARAHGGKTLEMKMAENKDALIAAGFPYDAETGEFVYSDETMQAWEEISAAFAEGASGEIRVVFGNDLNTLRGDIDSGDVYEYESIWSRQEYGRIEANPNVSRLTAIDPYSYEKSEVFSRTIEAPELSGIASGEKTEEVPAAAETGGSGASSSASAAINSGFQSSYEDRIRHTPSLESKRWLGERGESVCAPQSDAARQILEERGLTGVAYQNGVPDFSPFAVTSVKLGYEVLTRYPGMVLSFQMIPTRFVQSEASFVQGVMSYLNLAGQTGHAPMQSNDAVDFYRRTLEVLDKPQYLYNVVIAGPSEGAMMAASRLRSILQREDGAVGVSVIDRTGNLPHFGRAFAMYPWNMIAVKTQNPEKPEITPVHFRRMVHMISAAEALTFFHTPIDEGTVTGFEVNRIRVSRETFHKGVIDEGSIQLGRLMGTGSSQVAFGAPLKGFTRHALVVGMPGTGKTTFSVNLLLQFYKRGIPFLAIEPTKSEYRAMIDAVPDLQVFTPGKNSVVPFIINPFLPPDGITLETFKPSLVSAFKAAFSMPTPLDILFANAIDACYVKYGWRGYSKRGDPGTKPFGLHEFVMTFREIIRNSNYSAESKGNMESAGVFRLLNLVIQNGNIYDTENSVPLSDLLRKPTIIELNAIDNQEQKALIMALLLINIVLFTKHHQAGDGKLKNIMLIDEAHVLLGGSGSAAQEGAAEAGASTVKALQNMIVEIRSYGTGIIIADQSPQKVTKEIVGNTDVKVMFQLVQVEDKNIIAASSNMNENDKDQLSRLNTGEAYVYFRGLVEPVRIMTEDIREKEGIRLVVPDSELVQKMHYWEDKQELLKPYSQCSICSVCQQCDFTLRDDAKYFVEQFFSKDKPQIKDKSALFARVVNMDKRLKGSCGDYTGERYRQLLYCTCVRYIRKAALETPAILSETEFSRVLNRVMEARDADACAEGIE